MTMPTQTVSEPALPGHVSTTHGRTLLVARDTLFPQPSSVVADLPPAAVVTSSTSRHLLADYFAKTQHAPYGITLPWLNPALLLDGAGTVRDGDYAVAPKNFCAQTASKGVHARHRAAQALVLGAWCLLLAAGAG